MSDRFAICLPITLAYEGAKNIVAYTASDTISVTVFQKIRLKFDAPVFYDRFSVGVPGGVLVPRALVRFRPMIVGSWSAERNESPA